MSARKKTTKKQGGPSRGGKRAGAGRKPVDGARCALLSVRVTKEAKTKVETTAEGRGITTGVLVQDWADNWL
jgi:hypothetical protein